MAMNLEQILGLPRLLGLIQETTSGLPMEEVFRAKLPGLLSTTEDVVGWTGQATLTKGQRKVPKRVANNAPPVGADLETIGTQNWVLAATSEVITIDPVTFQQLRAYDSYAYQKMGAEEIGRQIMLFKQKFTNWELCLIVMALVKGIIYFDVDGNLLPTSSGAAGPEIDLLVPATHKNQIDGIIDIPWSNPNANIPFQIQKIMQRAAEDTGMFPTVALYGANVPSWLLQNQYVINYQARMPAYQNAAVFDNMIPDGYLGISKWVNGSTFFYEDASGVNQRLVPNDSVTLFPEPSKLWYTLLKGSQLLPKTLNIVGGDAESLMSNIEQHFGMYVYGQIKNRPISLELVGGHNMLPQLRVPNALFQMDVDF